MAAIKGKQRLTPIPCWLLLPLAVLLAGSNVVAQDSSTATWETGGVLNGRYWEALSYPAKLAYLYGFRQGVLVGVAQLGGGKTFSPKMAEVINSFQAAGFTYDDHVKELDRLYADRENIRIPIGQALQYCAIKLRGRSTKAQLEQLLIRLRALDDEKP